MYSPLNIQIDDIIEHYGRWKCISCGGMRMATLWNIRPRKLCLVCNVIHDSYCCDCYRKNKEENINEE